MLITTGDPQGSVLGPFLFSICINDLPLCSKIFEMIMYADDTTLYCDIHGVPNIQHLLNAKLSKISDWLAANKLSLNVSKTKLIIFHSDKRDIHDLAKINSRLMPFAPFSEDRPLQNIVTCIEAPSDTNVHEYKAVRMNIINTMFSQAAFQYSFKRNDSAKTLGHSSSVPIAPDRTIDPALLFQRSIVVSQAGISPCRK